MSLHVPLEWFICLRVDGENNETEKSTGDSGARVGSLVQPVAAAAATATAAAQWAVRARWPVRMCHNTQPMRTGYLGIQVKLTGEKSAAPIRVASSLWLFVGQPGTLLITD